MGVEPPLSPSAPSFGATASKVFVCVLKVAVPGSSISESWTLKVPLRSAARLLATMVPINVAEFASTAESRLLLPETVLVVRVSELPVE